MARTYIKLNRKAMELKISFDEHSFIAHPYHVPETLSIIIMINKNSSIT